MNSQMYNSASNSGHFNHVPVTQINPIIPFHQVVHQPLINQMHPIKYSKSSYTVNNAIPVITRHVSPIRSLPPIAINQQYFPKSLGDYSGPIISISPSIKGARFHLTNNKKFPAYSTKRQ